MRKQKIPALAILYCHADGRSKKSEPGHCFFDLGQYALCASASQRANGLWHVQLYYTPHGKSRPVQDTFDDIEAVKAFVGKFFVRPVFKVRPSEFPEPDM